MTSGKGEVRKEVHCVVQIYKGVSTEDRTQKREGIKNRMR